MTDILSIIRIHEAEGNFNEAILAIARNYKELALLAPELFKKVHHYLREFRWFISPDTIQTLKGLPDTILQETGISRFFNSIHNISSPPPGKIAFPVVTSIGMIREIVVTKRETTNFLPSRLQILDQTGSAIFRTLKKRLNRTCIWNPNDFAFNILDPYGKDDPRVTGDSMSLPLALALYSFITGVPVPPDLSATGKVARNGRIGKVSSLELKVQTICRERFFIKRILVPAHQKISSLRSNIQILEVKSLDEAISVAFPNEPDLARFSARIEVDDEIRALLKQYKDYLFDTSLENANQLIKLLKSPGVKHYPSKIIPGLFKCYWIKGSCYCHKGESEKSLKWLNKAKSLYEKYPGIIQTEDYFTAQIQYGVILKDIFRYRDAERLHLRLIGEMELCRALNHTIGMNLSTLSQLYLAMGLFEKAEEFQRKAICLINQEETARNYGYLAQIHTRSGNFRKAASAFAQYNHLINSKTPEMKSHYVPYYHWYRSEYLYRRILSSTKVRNRLLEELKEIASSYPNVSWYVPALIHKFLGLSLLISGEQDQGLKELEKACNYFDSQFAPILRVLGASVHAEKALFHISSTTTDRSFLDIKAIIEDLSLQKDIKSHFRSEISSLSKLVRRGIIEKVDVDNALKILKTIVSKIPY